MLHHSPIFCLHLSGLFFGMIFRMSKLFKNISVFPLWLAGLVIIAHLLIPHDHHFDISVSNENCPVHCHAFNDLIDEKHTALLITNQEFPSLELPAFEISDPIPFYLIIKNNRFSDLQKPPTKFDFLKYSPLRAPPSLV